MGEELSIHLQPGTVIGGKYEVVKCLGSGSMGSVYACRNQVLQGQLVAMKVLFPEVASDKVASARFKNEILASYEVSHPNVVRAYEYFTDRDLVAYTMEYVGGGDLAEKLGSDQRMSVPEIVKLLSQMAAGCQAIHDAGIVHRDLKPENILLTAEGNVKIADFGIARNRHGPKLTEHGGVVGTIDYVAPEYILNLQVDWKSDIYAIGILAYEMVTGESPFKGENLYATMTKRLKTDPEPPSKLRSECPEELDRIILKAMQREPEHRYQKALDMFLDLQKLADGMGIGEGDSAAHMRQAYASGSSARRQSSPEMSANQAFVGAATTSAAGGSSESEGGGATLLLDPDVAEEIPTSPNSQKGKPRSHDTEVIGGPFTEFSVEIDGLEGAPYSASDPLVSRYGESSRDDTVPEGKFRSSRGVGRARRDVENESNWAEILALVFAGAVGIGCGFVFLKLFAPSLLAKWYF
jgi:serine/threonine protein kinase